MSDDLAARSEQGDREPVARLVEDEPDGVWMPAGMPVFRVGDRVQIRLSGECRDHGDERFAADINRQDGMSGRIVYLTEAVAPGHTLAVHIDAPFMSSVSRGRCVVGTVCAPSELVPLPLAAGHGAVGDGEGE